MSQFQVFVKDDTNTQFPLGSEYAISNTSHYLSRMFGFHTVIFPVNLTSLELAPTYTVNSPLGTTHLPPSQTLKSLLLNLNVATPLAPASNFSLLNPRSCFGGVDGADAGYPM